MRFKIDQELKDYIPTADPELSDARLETLILSDGLTTPLVIWKEKETLIDGHRRLSILRKHAIKPKFRTMSFPDKAAVKRWMDFNAIGQTRRLTEPQWKMILARYAAAERDGTHNVAAKLAKKFNRSERQVHRDIKQGQAIESLPRDLQQRILSGEVKASAADLEELASLPEERQRQVFREMDGEGIKKLAPILHDDETPDEPELDFDPAQLEAAQPPPNGRIRYDDRKIEKLFGQLVREFDEREQEVGGDRAVYADVRDALDKALRGWKVLTGEE